MFSTIHKLSKGIQCTFWHIKRYCLNFSFKKMSNENLRENMLLGLGNPLLDISAVVEENLLKKYDLKEDEAILASEKHLSLFNLLVDKYDVEYIAGGSVQNTLRVAQWLLGKPNVVTFFGSVGDDEFSKILQDQAQKAGVNVQYQYNPNVPTGTCAVLITNQHRTLCANLAAANCFTIDHIRKEANKKLIETASFYYISGFFLTVSVPSILEVAKYALEHKKSFVMNLSSEFICKAFKEQFMQVMPYVDILFGNDAEALAFAEGTDFNTTNLKEIALKLCKLPKQNEGRERIVVITQGTKPVLLARNGNIQEFSVIALPKESIVDTNGAGDAFAGGFLSQFIQGKKIDVCVKCGIWAATEIVQRSGCTFDGKPGFVERIFLNILGIGHPILDVTIQTDMNFLKKYQLIENQAHVASKKQEKLFIEIMNKDGVNYSAGGSVYNTLSIIKWFLKQEIEASTIEVTFLGCTGEDKHSEIIENTARRAGVHAIFKKNSRMHTNICAVLITNNLTRTLCTRNGAANFFTREDLEKNWAVVENAGIYYFSSFFFNVSAECILKIAEYSKCSGKYFVMNLGAKFICEKYYEEFLTILQYIDIIFGNEEEVVALGKPCNFGVSLEEIMSSISNYSEPELGKSARTCVITRGENPVVLLHQGKFRQFPVQTVENIVNTNGAGDAFVGGFLSQFIMGENLETCVQCGIFAASKIIQRIDCEMN